MNTDTKQQIEIALKAFAGADLHAAAIGLLHTLGYQSEKTLDLDNTPDAFLVEFDKRDRKFRKDKALFERWKSVEFLFQITDDEVQSAGGQVGLDFQSGLDTRNYQSYLFFALDLEKNHYTRTQLADITREINLLFDMPAMLLIRHNGALTFSIIDRRLHKKDQSRDVLEKVKLIKDIRYQDPHRAHIEILHDLSLQALMVKHQCQDFQQLHEAWRKTLDTNELNKKFYRELADWYFWALDHVEFPADVEKDEATRNATNVIRLLTRLIFCWFLKEKGLIPADLFSERKLAGVLKSLQDDDSTFYQAILQNLFFGTLNQRMNTGDKANRKFTSDGSFLERRNEYGVKNLYRYQKLFAIAEQEAVKLFSDIPFLNGGLFDCLDKDDDSGKGIYVDGFSRNSRKQPRVPNFLFFSDFQTLDLSDAYGDKKKKKEKVRGLINLLGSYKFTVTENTPIEEEIALDPELLGKVFENLLASYNPETGTTARKQTGSFYTPREIVHYMVDESLIAYLDGQLKAKVPKLAEMKDLHDLLREVFAYTEKVHPFDEEEVDALIDAIDSCKILDPACGSGAFPMGILHKLVFILGKVDPHNERWKRKQLDKLDSISMREELERIFADNDDDYGRKLYLIENCIYGVDIQPIAIQISKLRFFISLICDQRTNKNKAQNCGVRPLPNLETRFVAANTLISLDRGQGQQFLLTDPRLPKLEKELAEVRHKHFAAQRRRNKLALQKRDGVLREEIATVLADGGMSSEASHQLAAWDPYDQNTSAPFFDPEWMYGIADGFDVVIGNPPYVRIQTLKQQDPAQVELFKERYEAAKKGNYDLYVVFAEHGLNMLSPRGQLAYILPHKFFKAQYGEPLRRLLSDGRHLRHVVHFGDQQIFPGSTNYVCLLFLDSAGVDTCRWGQVNDLSEWLTSFSSPEGSIPSNRFNQSEWNVVIGKEAGLFDRLREMPATLGSLAQKISQGIRTSANEVYVLDIVADNGERLTVYSKQLDAETQIERASVLCFLQGREIKPYSTSYSGKVVLMPYKLEGGHMVLIPECEYRSTFPLAWGYLEKNRCVLESRENGRMRGPGWYGFIYPKNLDVMFAGKILVPDIASRASFAIDTRGEFAFTSGYGVILQPEVQLSPLYLLGLLNSRLLDYFWKGVSTQLRGGFYRYFSQFIKQLPIYPIDLANRAEATEHDATAALVERILTAKKADITGDTTEWEREIDERVYRLYGLTSAEIAIVEGKSV